MKIEIEGAVILKDGEQIGTIEGDTAAMNAATPPAIKGKINEVAGRKLTFTVGESDPVEEKAETPAPAKESARPEEPLQRPGWARPTFRNEDTERR